MKLIYSGPDYYWDSGTVMGSLYTLNGRSYQRSDWGKVEIALRSGEEISIRQPTEVEKLMFAEMLIRIQKEQRTHHREGARGD